MNIARLTGVIWKFKARIVKRCAQNETVRGWKLRP